MPTAKALRPDEILKQLADLWTNMGTPHTAETHDDSGALLRACAMTLIAFVDDEEDAVALNATLSALMREHPSRMIVIRLRDGEDDLDARVFAQCWMPFGHHRQICCEQVEISASVNRLADVASIVAPLAMADLPRVIVLRSARIVRAGALRKILPLGDKIIIDSSRAGAPGFGELGGLLEANYITGDLAWTRITETRALIAQLLDDRVPSRITVEYCGREAGPEARYLQAWLGTCLPGVLTGLKGNGQPGDGKPTVIGVDSDVALRLGRCGAEYDAGTLHHFASMSEGTEDQLLNEEIGIVVHDRVFERALNRITA